MLRMLTSIVLVGLGVYGALSLGLYTFQSQLVFLPDRRIVLTPADRGYAYEEVWIPVEDEERIHAWWIPGPDEEDAPAVLFLHGNAGNISHRLDTVRILHGLGLSVLLVDYRGYGRSDGKPGEAATYADADAAWRWLVEVRAIPPERLVLFGRSLGAAVAIELATRRPAAALIAESPFTSAPGLAAELYPIFPVRQLARIRYPNRERIARVGMPVLVIHARRDEIIPFRHGQAVFDAAAEPRRFLELRGGHNDGFLATGAAYPAGIGSFLEEVGGLRPGGAVEDVGGY
jgi:uncharacterized protein